MKRLITTLFSIAVFVGPARMAAWAHEGHDHEKTCPPGEVCGQATAYGAWGMIAMGLLFWAVALMPPIPPESDDETSRPGFSMFTMLQLRLDKETVGWRRLQWPVLGLAFIALGVATLVGWL